MRYTYFLKISLFTVGLFIVASCGYKPKNDGADTLQPWAPVPIVKPVQLISPIKLDLAAIKAVPVKMTVRKLDIDKLPSYPYDTTDFKPYSKPVEEVAFNYDNLPEKDFNIDKLPSRPIKFKTFRLPPPRMIKAGLPHLKNVRRGVYECGEGLQGSLNNITKDADGFIWIATTRGIYRYDGENFVLFLPARDERVVNISADSMGRIWFSHTVSNDISILDPKEGTLKTASFSAMPARYLTDDHGRIWVTTLGDGVHIINPDLQTEKLFGKPQGLSSSAACAIGACADGTIWIGCITKGIDIIDLKKNKIKYLTRANGLTLNTITGMLCEGNGQVWLGSGNDGLLACVDTRNKTIQYIREVAYPANSVSEIMEGTGGRIWVGTADSGVVVLDHRARTMTRYSMRDGLGGNLLYSMVRDDQNQVWLSTDSGLSRIASHKITKQKIKSSNAAAIEDESGAVWIYDVAGGLTILDRKAGALRKLRKQDGLVNDTIQQLITSKHKILIATNGGLNILDKQNNTISTVTQAQGLFNKEIYSITIDRKGIVWLGGSHGIDILNLADHTLKHIGKSEGLTEVQGNIYCILNDSSGRIWIAYSSGNIDIINLKTHTLRYLKGALYTTGAWAYALREDSHGNVWVGGNNGAAMVDLQAMTATSFTTDQGLADDMVLALLFRNEKVYVSSRNGISIITRTVGQKWAIKTFGQASGVKPNAKGYIMDDLITADGLYWRGGGDLSVLDLTEKDTSENRALIARIRIMDKPQYFAGRFAGPSGSKNGALPLNRGSAVPGINKGLEWAGISGPFNLPQNLVIPYDQNFMQFKYSSFNLTGIDSAQYRYKLEGADPAWSEATNDNATRNYVNLKPGGYTFKLKAQNADGSWGKTASYSFTIRPPWWETWWARGFFVLLLVALIWLVTYYRSRSLLRAKRLLEEKVRLRTTEVLEQKEEIETQRDSLEIQRTDLENTLTELRTTQAQLVQSAKMASLGELTAGIAHEIQNPLNFVNNFSEVSAELVDELEEGLIKGDIEGAQAVACDIKENLLKIRHHGTRADGIVKGMLEHSRATSGQKQPMDINKLADEYLRLSYHGLRAKDKSFNAALVTNFDKTMPLVNLVPQDFGRVLLNLFNNAFYAVRQKEKSAATSYSPTVEVSTATVNGNVLLTVRDNGTGIPDAIKDKIMQPFFTTKPTGQGTGLGLSLSYDIIVKGHNGEINVKSVFNEFTEIMITIPSL